MADLAQRLQFIVENSVEVSALVLRPSDARWVLVLAHGAGAGMAHPFLQKLANELATAGIATFRYQFPYMEQRRRVPDSPALLTTTVARAVEVAAETVPELPILAGGKSMGGRMTSQTVAQRSLPGIRGLVFFGFPLHPPGRPGTQRADHLAKVGTPMLFLQGTRDEFADMALLRPVCEKLDSRATLHVIDGADHSFHMPKKSPKTDSEVLRELVQTVAGWAAKL